MRSSIAVAALALFAVPLLAGAGDGTAPKLISPAPVEMQDSELVQAAKNASEHTNESKVTINQANLVKARRPERRRGSAPEEPTAPPPPQLTMERNGPDAMADFRATIANTKNVKVISRTDTSMVASKPPQEQ